MATAVDLLKNPLTETLQQELEANFISTIRDNASQMHYLTRPNSPVRLKVYDSTQSPLKELNRMSQLVTIGILEDLIDPTSIGEMLTFVGDFLPRYGAALKESSLPIEQMELQYRPRNLSFVPTAEQQLVDQWGRKPNILTMLPLVDDDVYIISSESLQKQPEDPGFFAFVRKPEDTDSRGRAINETVKRFGVITTSIFNAIA